MVSTPRFYLTSLAIAFFFSLFWLGKEKKKLEFPWAPIGIATFWILAASLFIQYDEKENLSILDLITKSVDPSYFFKGTDRIALRGPGSLAMFSIGVFFTSFTWAWQTKNYLQNKKAYRGDSRNGDKPRVKS